MATKHTLVGVIVGVLASFLFISQRNNFPVTAALVQENEQQTQKPKIKKFVIVQVKTYVTKENYESCRRPWIKLPDGRFKIIPEAYQAWAKSMIDGQNTTVPESVELWDKPYDAEKIPLDGMETRGKYETFYRSIDIYSY